MQLLGLDIAHIAHIAHIAELGTQLAQSGAIRAGEVISDELFEYAIGIAILIYEEMPGLT